MFKKYSFPEKYQDKIERALQELGYSLTRPKDLAKCIIDLSDFYQQKQKITPWALPATQAAYLAYFFPLNYIRNLKVFDELKRRDFPPLGPNFLDFGFGLGSGFLAARDSGLISAEVTVHGVDSSPVPLELFKKFLMEPGDRVLFHQHLKNSLDVNCALFSYSLNELPNEAHWIFKIPNLIIIEPSTQQAGRHLMARRQELITAGFHLRAPCTHQSSCPLLVHSKTDWCHDRVHWTPPAWWKSLEAFLPMKNQTMTFSYLAACRIEIPATLSMPASVGGDMSEFPGGFTNGVAGGLPHHFVGTALGRVVGDELVEKGKSRWLYCRGEEREFLSWLNRSGEPPEIHRGELLQIDIQEKKGNELRFAFARQD